jgi:glycosyltransferase involved in cell wall biosynthesis
MRLAFLYGKFSLGQRPLDFDNLYTAPRGLTGSELSCIAYALAMKHRGHDVALIVGQKMEPREWRGLNVFPLNDPRIVDGCDAVLSWNEPDLFREISPGPLRVINQQLNDFGYCRPGWGEHVDIITSPAAHHMAFLQSQVGADKDRDGAPRWEVLPNGCDPTQYDLARERIPGRVIWASSADRGLHLLLEAWPEIKQRVPHASLRAFYNFQPADFDEYEKGGPAIQPDLLELAQRKRYIQYAMGKLSGPTWDVEHVGSVSRDRIRSEFEKSSVLAYPCDTIRYTEGFSVTTMEACASGCLPVITDIDSLGHIYGGAAPMVSMAWPFTLQDSTNPALNGKSFAGGFTESVATEFVDLVVRGLTDDAWRAEQVTKCRALAERHAWPVLAQHLESIIDGGLVRRVASSHGINGKKNSKPKKKAAAGAPAAARSER